MRVSVVICTYNRAEGLRDTLKCLRHQHHDQFEVVVVNGPSTDHTTDVLAEFTGMIRAETCPAPNLSMSRNIGIRSAAGDIVAFIDDDALPEFDWLAQAVPAFTEPDVAGVGGIVFDHTGVTLQYSYSAANRFAETVYSDSQPFDSFCAPGAFTFPYLQGTNALFRRATLLRVGGFDETFDYYLDETDVCCRLVDAGYVLRQLPDAPVHHKFLPSGIRDHQRIVTNWFPIIKNHTYFSYRHALGAFSEAEVIRRSMAFVDERLADVALHEAAGRLPVGTIERARTICGEGLGRGIELGRSGADRIIMPLDDPSNEFLRYPAGDVHGWKRTVIISGDYAPRITGGIARIMSDLAPALSRHGHEVRVITRSEAHSTVDLEEGVWVHRLVATAAGATGVAPGTLAHINDFTTAAAAELERIGRWAPIDAVYGPAWDVEILGALERTTLPAVVMLATPVAVTATQHGGSELSPEIARLLELERDVYRSADLVHALSQAIVTTVEHGYGAVLEPARTDVIALGLPDHGTGATRAAADHTPLRVLFVGRLEPRKGIEDFFVAVEQLAAQDLDLGYIVAGPDTPTADGTNTIGQEWLEHHAGSAWLDRVELTGRVTDEELHRLYATADIVVLPSRYESFGLVVVEAMMHGKAIVSCDTGGIPEVAQSGVDAVLVPPADPSALADAIAVLARDPERRRLLGEAARRSYEERLTVDACAVNVSSLLRRLSVAGTRCTTVATGESHVVGAFDGGPTTVPLRARGGAATARVEVASHSTTYELTADRWTRVHVSDAAQDVRVTATAGLVDVAPSIQLDRRQP